MKLSDAILLGDTLKTPNPNEWLSGDTSCGCALGGALLAVGLGQQFLDAPVLDVCDFRKAKKLWPWLTGEHTRKISALYGRVVEQGLPLEHLLAYVRSIELPEEHTGTTLTELEKAVRDAEIKAGIERSEPSSDSETSAELSAGIQRGCGL